MGFLSRKTEMPTRDDRAAGARAVRCRCRTKHFVLGNPIAPPFPDGLELALFGMGCFWGAEKKFWQAPGVYTTAVGYAGGLTPNPLYEEVCSGRTGHNEVVRVVFDPARHELRRDAADLLGEPRPHAGHAPGQRRRHAVPLGDLRARRRAARGRGGVARRLRRAARRGGLRRDHHRDPRCARVLLRRGLSPAVPRQEPARVLRARRHGRLVPDRSAPSA